MSNVTDYFVRGSDCIIIEFDIIDLIICVIFYMTKSGFYRGLHLVTLIGSRNVIVLFLNRLQRRSKAVQYNINHVQSFIHVPSCNTILKNSGCTL